MCAYLGQYTEAEGYLKQAKSFSTDKGIGDAVKAMAHSWLGSVYLAEERHAEAEPQVRRALDLARKIHDRRLAFIQLANLSCVTIARGRFSEGEEYWRQADAELEAIEATPWELFHLHSVGAYIDCEKGQLAEAETSFRKALQAFDDAELVEHFGIALFLEAFANLLRQSDKHREADELQKRAQDIRNELRSQWDGLQGTTLLDTHPRETS